MRCAERPWALVPNKFHRYPGGREIDRFRGVSPAVDDGHPEAWVGSTTPLRHPRFEGEGLAWCDLPDGRRALVRDAITEDPEGALGEGHVRRFGPEPGFLVKLLDAEKQLGFQCHPTREKAKRLFGSAFGKEESWVILGLREDVPEPPYVLLGFREHVDRAFFERAYFAQDAAAIDACCHKIPVRVGDVFLVPGGMPHAIGAGCFLAEVQEASDITVGARRRMEGTPGEITERDRRLLDTYEYEPRSYEENLQRLRLAPRLLRSGPWGREEMLIGPEATPYFGCTRLSIDGEAPLGDTGACRVGVVLGGEGGLRFPGGALPVRKSSEVFLPAAARVSATGRLEMLLCHPQGAELER